MAFQTHEEAQQYLREIGRMEDADIDLAEGALALGLIFLPGVSIDKYRQHLKKMSEQLAAENAGEDLAARVAALRKVIHELNGYDGDPDNDDNTENANFVRVLERRKGVAVALGIIYLTLARSQGWDAAGLNFPGRFILRVEQGAERVLLDPYRQGLEMDAAKLRQLLKSIIGDHAELSHSFYETSEKRDILERLQNNLKKRYIDAEDYAQAIAAAESIGAFYPAEYRIFLDKGVLYARMGQNKLAAAALETYIERAPTAQEKGQARLLLNQIKSELD